MIRYRQHRKGVSQRRLNFETVEIWAVVLLLFIEIGNLGMEVGSVGHDYF